MLFHIRRVLCFSDSLFRQRYIIRIQINSDIMLALAYCGDRSRSRADEWIENDAAFRTAGGNTSVRKLFRKRGVVRAAIGFRIDLPHVPRIALSVRAANLR